MHITPTRTEDNMSRIEDIAGAKAGDAVTMKPSLIIIDNGFSHTVTEVVKSVSCPENVVVIYDHNVPAGLPEESRIFQEIYHFADDHGIAFRQAKGIGCKWLLEEKKIQAGDIVIGGTRHMAAAGSVGAMGIGLSYTELSRVLESGEYQMVVPETVIVEVKGSLPEGTGIIDAALSFLQKAGHLQGKALEFICNGLTQHEKEALCEMAVDTGAFTAFAVESGEADMVLDLSQVSPMLRLPCDDLFKQVSADFAEVSSLDGTHIHAGQIGGINGGDIEDLRKAAQMMEGRKLKLGFRLTINPASSQVYLKALEEGLITRFIDYNAQIGAAGDHDIVPQGAGAMGPKEVLLTTGLYTYDGAMGCSDAKIYTASVETIMRASFE